MDYPTLIKYSLHFFLTIQIVWGVDEVMLVNPPEKPVSDYPLKILYSCDSPAIARLECIISFDTSTITTLLLRQWNCVPGSTRVRTVQLGLPDWLVYQADGIVPESLWVLSSILRVSLRHSGSVPVQDVAILHPEDPLSRPFKRHQLCHAWGTAMVRLNPRTPQCPLEKETVHLLSSMYASTGEVFGVTKTLQGYTSVVLEHLRLNSVSFPWCMFSIWVFLVKRCQKSVCGMFYHLDSDETYVTPSLFLTNAGQLHVQMNGLQKKSSAFVTPFSVPLNQWCHFGVAIRDKTVNVSMVCKDRQKDTVHSVEHTYSHNVVLDDTEGYFVIGGGKYVGGMEGYFGPLVYYRNRIPPPSTYEVVVPELVKNMNLTGWLKTCKEFRLELNVKICGYSRIAMQKSETESCVAVYPKWILNNRLSLKTQCEPWEASRPERRQATKLAKMLVYKHGGQVTLETVGSALYSLAMQKLGKASSVGTISRILPLILQAGCLGQNQALHLSSTLYHNGLGVNRDPSKSWLLAHLAAQRDARLSLLHLGHEHLSADPADPDLAYSYYANIAKQTVADRQNPSAQQAFVETIYLNDEEGIYLQTNENHHIFQWLKLQARNGVAEAEQAVSRMLFWGQQGVAPNMEKAARHYARGAVRLEDPESIYNYAIVLMQGHGVERDLPKAVALLKKAMEKGFAPAFNALAWYYEEFEKDYERAVQLWETADLYGSPDAAMNLGVMYSQGRYPGKSADKVMAYKYYLKSAERGSINGAIHTSDIWTTGITGHVERRPLEAVLWTKWAAEHNGYLGKVLRKALDSYLKDNMFMSLVFYMMAAHTGYAAALFNVAYLCEQNEGGYLDPGYAAQCMMTFYNLTSQSRNPNTYALLRMGDLLYEGDSVSAAHMYKQAALRNEAQGWYNLGLLTEDGFKIPLSVLIDLGLPKLYLAEKSLLLTALYTRCRDSESTDSYLPCTIALFKVYIQTLQNDYSASIKFSTTVAVVVVAPTVLLIILGILRGRALSRNAPV